MNKTVYRVVWLIQLGLLLVQIVACYYFQLATTALIEGQDTSAVLAQMNRGMSLVEASLLLQVGLIGYPVWMLRTKAAKKDGTLNEEVSDKPKDPTGG